jgi:hypothetical protein
MDGHPPEVIAGVCGADVNQAEGRAVGRHLDVKVPAATGAASQVCGAAAVTAQRADGEGLASHRGVAALPVSCNSGCAQSAAIQNEGGLHGGQSTTGVAGEAYHPGSGQVTLADVAGGIAGRHQQNHSRDGEPEQKHNSCRLTTTVYGLLRRKFPGKRLYLILHMSSPFPSFWLELLPPWFG